MIRTASLTKALNSYQKTADKIENKIKTNKNRESVENKQRLKIKYGEIQKNPLTDFLKRCIVSITIQKGREI